MVFKQDNRYFSREKRSSSKPAHEKEPKGNVKPDFQEGLNTPPIATSEASYSTIQSFLKSSIVKIGAFATIFRVVQNS